MTELLIRVGRTGVRDVESRVMTAAQAREAGQLSSAIALPLSLMDRTLREVDGAHIEDRNIDPFVWVVRDGRFNRVRLCQAEPVRWLFERVPGWLVVAMKKIFPAPSDWESAPHLPGGEGEIAAMLLQQVLARGILDHAGWADDDCLVTEPYAIDDLERLSSLTDFCRKCGLECKIRGRSYHAPSDTIRIRISPAIK